MKNFLNKEVPLKKTIKQSDQSDLAAESKTTPLIAQVHFGQMES